MAIVLRLGPLPLGGRRAARVAELERIFGTGVELFEVFSVAQLAAAARPDVSAVALDAPPPGQLNEAVSAAGSRPVLRPLWRGERNSRGETDEHFAGYGLLTGTDVVRLADGELSSP
jgi:hypothetical protein